MRIVDVKADLAPVAAGLVLAALAMTFVPRWQAAAQWSPAHTVAMTYGAVWGNCGVMFYGFGGGFDLYAKIVMDAVAAALMVWLAVAALRRAR